MLQSKDKNSYLNLYLMLKKIEMLQILKTLEFDSEAMSRLLAVIDGVEGDTLDDDAITEIKTILLEEEEKALDQAAAELGIDVTSDASLYAAEAEYKREVDAIKSELESDMSVLDEQLDQLDAADNELTKVDEQIQITQITQTIKAM